MPKAFSVPVTPQGKSALATLPPWHYSSDCIAIEYWADPGAIEAFLPPGLIPDKKSGGRAFFWFLDWQFTGSNDELTDPARYSIPRGVRAGRGDLRWLAGKLLPLYFRRQRRCDCARLGAGIPKETRHHLPDTELLRA